MSKSATKDQKKQIKDGAKEIVDAVINPTMTTNGRRRVHKPPKPDDKRLKANRERTEAQKAAGFQKGNSGNPGGWNMKRPTRAFREKLHTIVSTAGVEMLVNLLYQSYEDKAFKETLAIIEFMSHYAYGKPSEMRPTEDEEPQKTELTNGAMIIAAKEDLRAALLSDTDYN